MIIKCECGKCFKVKNDNCLFAYNAFDDCFEFVKDYFINNKKMTYSIRSYTSSKTTYVMKHDVFEVNQLTNYIEFTEIDIYLDKYISNLIFE